MALRQITRQAQNRANSVASPFNQPLLLLKSQLYVYQEKFRTTPGTKSPANSRLLRTLPSHSVKVKQYNYNDIRNLLEAPDTDKVLIDVREPSEYEEGYIPSAFNLPITSVPDALFLDPQEFRDQLGFSKPSLANEVIFYCLAGIRSSIAAGKALQSGYTRVGEYKGSFLDWERQGGATSKNPSGKIIN